MALKCKRPHHFTHSDVKRSALYLPSSCSWSGSQIKNQVLTFQRIHYSWKPRWLELKQKLLLNLKSTWEAFKILIFTVTGKRHVIGLECSTQERDLTQPLVCCIRRWHRVTWCYTAPCCSRWYCTMHTQGTKNVHKRRSKLLRDYARPSSCARLGKSIQN